MAKPMRASQRVLIPLSAVMIFFATLAFTGIPDVLKRPSARMFTTIRMPTGEHFLDYRRRTAPMAIYGGLHALPAIIWSVLIPFQHVDSLRRKFPAMHRTSGYVILSFSLLLSMTGYWFFLSKNAYSHANWYHLHDLGGFAAPLAWPTFEATTFLLAPFYWATMYKTAVTASAGDYAAHRKWAVLHTMTACFISLERVAIIIMTGAGLVLTLFPEEEVHAFFGVPDTVDAIAAAELDLFAFGNIIALGLAAAWAAYELNRAGQLDGWKRYLASMVQEEPVAKKVE